MRLGSVLLHAAVVGILALFTATAPAGATVVIIPTLEEMTLGADVVARVVVGEQRVVRDGGRLLTFTALEVKDGIKGAKAADRLEVFQVGGELDGKSSWIVGAHRFRKGEELFFFGVRHPSARAKDGAPMVVPWGIGVGLFSVVDDLTGPKVVELIGDVAAVEPGPDGKPRAVTPQARRYDSPAAFRETLRRILEAGVTGADLPQLPLKKKLVPSLARPAPAQPLTPTKSLNSTSTPAATPAGRGE